MRLEIFVLIFLLCIGIYSCKKKNEEHKGCTDNIAVNFNPDASIDDGSCIIRGCTDPTADNYNPNANENDGSCIDARDKFIADWDVADDCNPLFFSLQNTQTITLNDTTLNKIIISSLLNIIGGNVSAVISGNTITIENQVIVNTSYSGSGTINSTKDAITIDYSYDTGLPLGNGTCTAVYTKL